MSKKQESFQEQLNRYLQGKMKRYEMFQPGKTPQFLEKYGVPSLQIQMPQSVLNKILRLPQEGKSRSAHGLSIEIVETIPELLSNPAMIIKDNNHESVALLSDRTDYEGNPLLLALKLNVNRNGVPGNEIRSLFGREHIDIFLEKHGNGITIVDKERAKQIFRLAEPRLSAALKSLDYDKTIPDSEQHVNPQNEKSARASPEIVKDIRLSGFQATKSLIRNIRKLDALTGKANTMKEICCTYRNGCAGMDQEQKSIIEQIAQECKQQELARMAAPPEA